MYPGSNIICFYKIGGQDSIIVFLGIFSSQPPGAKLYHNPFSPLVMAEYPIKVKLCEVTIMAIALAQEGGQTDTMTVKLQWHTCHTM